MRLSTDSQTQLAFIDFIDPTIKRTEFKAPKLPLVLMVSGNGTLQTPYKIDQSDLLSKQLVFLDQERLGTILPLFFQNLNMLLDKLSFYKFNR